MKLAGILRYVILALIVGLAGIAIALDASAQERVVGGVWVKNG